MKSSKSRNKYTDEYKADALKLAELKGVPTAAAELGLHTTQLYNWRSSLEKKASVSQREAELTAEVARLKRKLAEQAEELAIVKKAATYFAKNQK